MLISNVKLGKEREHPKSPEWVLVVGALIPIWCQEIV